MYGLIVIGDDLSSHIAAAVASSDGIKTALLSESGIGEEICLNNDLVFNVDPTPMTGFGANQAGSSLLEKIDIFMESNLLNPAYQIILPEHRIDFFNDKESLVNEIAREFPELSGEIKSLYDAVVKNSNIIDKWLQDHPYIQPQSLKDCVDYLKITPYLIKFKFDNNKLKRIMFRNASFKKVMEAQQALLSFKTKNHDSIFSHFQYSAPLRGIYYFSQGKKELLNYLIKKIESTKGLFLNNCEVLSINKGEVIEVTYNDKDGVASKIETANLIVSTKWQNMHLLMERKKKFNFDDLIRPIKVSYCPFTIHLGVRQKSIPEKMARHVAVVSDVDKHIYDDNLIILELQAPEGEGNVSSTQSLLSATVFLPDDQMTWSKENLTANARSIIERLEFFLPFLKENIEFFDIKESINVSQKQRGIVNPKYQLQNSFISGFAAKNNKTRFSNIFLTGASLLIDAGFEGEIISGMNAAARVTGKRK